MVMITAKIQNGSKKLLIFIDVNSNTWSFHLVCLEAQIKKKKDMNGLLKAM